MGVNLEFGKYLFHYTTRDKAFGGVLPNNTLRFSTYDKMRDPLENQEWHFASFVGYEQHDHDTLRADLERAVPFKRRANEEIRGRSHLLSMTMDAEPIGNARKPFCLGWARARMWEQYAEQHRGVCLAFEKDRLVRRVEDSMTKPGLSALYHEPVAYDDHPMSSPAVVWEALRTEAGLEEYIATNYQALFFEKTVDWQGEHEYRFVAIVRDGSTQCIDYADALKAVIAGEKLPEWEHPSIVAACEEVGADPLRVEWDRGRPGIVPLA